MAENKDGGIWVFVGEDEKGQWQDPLELSKDEKDDKEERVTKMTFLPQCASHMRGV